ncbi:DUF4333 domain-containing protein [Geodermatophilus ruber]|uniref:DUF4333 domain-containing protein n=1 Tax=Geodermatophilus ruber TaxID=504800 RepID=A0A1I4BTY5_9ACTN|nr:DUF4333 domain-containing protein [Geodermatophilus ruber]SFK72202.1 protein of unknown function [Geodermatophilus ruber]
MIHPPHGGDQPGQQHGQPGPYGQPGYPGRPAPGGYGAPQAPVPGQPVPQWGQAPQQYGPPYGQPPGPYGPPYGQQPYPYGPGAQPYPYGHGPQPTRSRTGLVVGLVALAVVVLAAAITLPILLGGEVLDRGAVERDVATQFEEAHDIGLDLSCDQEMAVEHGASYECTGTTEDGEGVTVRIAITDEDTAAYTWEEV